MTMLGLPVDPDVDVTPLPPRMGRAGRVLAALTSDTGTTVLLVIIAAGVLLLTLSVWVLILNQGVVDGHIQALRQQHTALMQSVYQWLRAHP